MKLAELKLSLVEQFFTNSTNGIPVELLSEVYESLKTYLNCNKLIESSSTSNHSNEPSKAFAQFTKGRSSILAIIEEDGINKTAIFAAAKKDTKISYMILTQENCEVKQGDLKIIKTALRQAKNINDDVDFNVITL